MPPPSAPEHHTEPPPAPRHQLPHAICVPVLLAITAVLAATSLVTDSATFDEPFHLAAGLSYLKTGDFRLSTDHPPLARMWVTWPLLFMNCKWPGFDNGFWRDADAAGFSVHWLYELNEGNGQRFIVVGRCMMVVLLLGTCLTIYGLGRMALGPPAGLLALVLACFSPALLAHGRLITTDLPITLATSLVLLSFGWMLQHVTWPRVATAAVALGAASVTKLSWPLVLPAVAAMGLITIVRRAPLAAAMNRVVSAPSRQVVRRGEKAAIVVGAWLVISAVTWAGIWTCYRWRTSMIAPLPPALDTPKSRAQQEQTVERIRIDWLRAMHHPDSLPRTGLVPAFLRFAVDHGLLPDAYLFGLARTLQFTSARMAYLMGEYSDTGWRSYFPIVFAIKTPIATLGLLAAGAAALISRRIRPRDTVVLAGLLVFAFVYGAFMIQSRTNLGQRHLLPIYPMVFVIAGAATVWLARRVGRWLVGAALIWLVGASLWIHPHYLAYFNELVGGPSRGHLYLADSNIDWGQDLRRLADHARAHPDEPVKLAYFGSAVPTRFLDCSALPSHFTFQPRAQLTPGIYVVSVTQALGVYDLEVRDSFWTEQNRLAYQALRQMAASDAAIEFNLPPAERDEAAREYEDLRSKRLLNRLRHREADARIGYSLFLHRLGAAEIEELTRP